MLEQQPEQRQTIRPLPILIGSSPATRKIIAFADVASNTDIPVLQRGETGTGKDNTAEVIHFLGRSHRQFVTINCGSLSESLAETEFFGHTGSAFTGAIKARSGLLDEAEEGTLFLNDVDTLTLNLQAKLLPVLDRKPFRAVGSTKERPSRARFIIASNANLEEKVEKRELREDLYYRFRAAIAFEMPTLLERKDDIPQFVKYFLKRERSNRSLSPQAWRFVMDYHWPGNLRELYSVVAGSNVQAQLHGEKEIMAPHVEACIPKARKAEPLPPRPAISTTGGTASNSRPEAATERFLTFWEVERKYWCEALTRTEGSVARAARIAGVARNTLHRKISEDPELEKFLGSLRES